TAFVKKLYVRLSAPWSRNAPRLCAQRHESIEPRCGTRTALSEGMKKHILATIAVLLWAPAAYAQSGRGGEDEFDAMIGGRVGIHASPGGGLVGTEYAHRLSQQAWFDLQLDMMFGGTGACFVDRAGFVDCGPYGGQSLDLIAGAKWKFHTRHERLVPYAKVGGGLAFLFWPGADNDAVAP